MKPDSLKLLKSSDRKARSRFLLPLAFCLLSVAFYIPPHSPHPASAQTTDARKTEADRLMQQVQQHQTSQLRAALNSWQQALQIYRTIKNRQGEGRALGNLGLSYHYLGNYVKAIEYGQQQLVIARKIKDRQGEGAVLTNLGLAFLTTGNPTESEKMLMNGIQVWESMRQLLGSNDVNQVSIFEGQANTYRTLQQVRVAQNNPIAALEIAERGRARAFVDLLTQRLSSGSSNPVIAAAPNQDEIRQIAKAQNAT